MKKTLLLIALILVSFWQVNAQGFNVHLNTGAIGFGERQVYPAYGFGLEAQASNRWTVFGEFDFGIKTNSSLQGFLVNRHLFSLQPGVRRYFKSNMSGFNISFFGVYSREIVDPQELNTIANSLLGSDKTGLGLGFGYVARLANNLTLGFDSGLAPTFEDNGTRFHFKLQLGYIFL